MKISKDVLGLLISYVKVLSVQSAAAVSVTLIARYLFLLPWHRSVDLGDLAFLWGSIAFLLYNYRKMTKFNAKEIERLAECRRVLDLATAVAGGPDLHAKPHNLIIIIGAKSQKDIGATLIGIAGQFLEGRVLVGTGEGTAVVGDGPRENNPGAQYFCDYKVRPERMN